MKHPGDVSHPGAHGRARQVDAVAAEDAFEAVERQMVGVLAGRDLGQQPRAGQAFWDDRDRHVCRSDMVMTLGAGVLKADMHVHEQASGSVIELFAGFLAELLAQFAAAGAHTLGVAQRVLDALPWQIRRQLLHTRYRVSRADTPAPPTCGPSLRSPARPVECSW